MWPILLDMTKEESMQHLRCLEIDAFSGLVNALRAQGNLNGDKLKLIKDTGTILHISQERHKAEIRRVVNDERLNTIAYHVNGERHSTEEWADEGQRLIPLMPRVAPQTAYSAIADEVADSASKLNKQLPLPASTERKRPISVSPTQSNASTSEQSNKNQIRVLEPDVKKRKLSLNMDNCGVLAQHLMAPPKISKIQQIYRQKSKTRLKEPLVKLKTHELDKSDYILQSIVTKPSSQPQQVMQQSAKMQPKIIVNQPTSVLHPPKPKINILHNISTTSGVASVFDEPNPHSLNTLNLTTIIPSTTENLASLKVDENFQPNTSLINSRTHSFNDNRLVKTCVPATRRTLPSKTITTTDGQKLIVVSTISPTHSNHSLTPSTSILQRTLTTIPFKNISMKNLDKFKIVSSTNTTPILQNAKQKVVTVRTTASKRIIPLSQVQVLNTKGGIKVLPIGGKIINNSNYYFTNTTSFDEESTKSTSSTSVMMSYKAQEGLPLPELVMNKLVNDEDMLAFNSSCSGSDENRTESISTSGTPGTSVSTTADEAGTDVGECEDEEECDRKTINENFANVNELNEKCHNNGVSENKMQLEETLESTQIHYKEEPETTAIHEQFDIQEVHEHNDIEMLVVHDDIHEISDNGFHHFDSSIEGTSYESEIAQSEMQLTDDPNVITNIINEVPLVDSNIIGGSEFNVKDFDANDILQHLNIQETGEVVVNHEVEEMQVGGEQVHLFDDKVDLDSSLFIYGNDQHEDVIIDGIADQPIEVLNVVHTIDESSFSN